jgi:hypothetical protein
MSKIDWVSWSVGSRSWRPPARNIGPALESLQQVETKLEHARLVREHTLCRESMPAAERRWLASNRSPLARHWNWLTGLTVEQLPYAG